MAKYLHITGRVQGVGFRHWICGEALALGLTGWVRNRRDGSVEAMVDGLEPMVQAMIQSAHRGPPGASVDAVRVEDAQGHFTCFEWRPTE